MRFAVGSPTEPYAEAWFVATHGANVYVATRSFGGLMKISLHLDSGVWIGSFTQESGITGPNGNRRLHRWEAPEMREGWNLAVGLIVPRVDAKHDLPFPASADQFKSVDWIPTPAIGNLVQVLLFLTSDPDARPDNEYVLGELPLTNGDRLWVVADERLIEKEERQGILGVRDRNREIDGISVGEPHDLSLGVGAISFGDPGRRYVRKGVDAASVLWYTKVEGLPCVVQIPIGSHNFNAPLLT